MHLAHFDVLSVSSVDADTLPDCIHHGAKRL